MASIHAQVEESRAIRKRSDEIHRLQKKLDESVAVNKKCNFKDRLLELLQEQNTSLERRKADLLAHMKEIEESSFDAVVSGFCEMKSCDARPYMYYPHTLEQTTRIDRFAADKLTKRRSLETQLAVICTEIEGVVESTTNLGGNREGEVVYEGDS